MAMWECTRNERRKLWQALEDLHPGDHHWIVVGDFNVIREDGKRIRGNPGVMDEFNSCLDNCELMEMSFSGRRFSWCNDHKGHSHSWARLDRAVMNTSFFNTFPNTHLEYLMRKLSNHSLIVINFDKLEMRNGPSPFRVG
ncbi:uncharacterized protein LOC131166623 [Malania oleifera]|uniref:uncharacterized protein LOC131166623 n=1 Tax=Malania oleifera TaxID=397392 RepID=UPI0025AE1105|nr:uncharacterized protein LOC131166623 [Malania oleifera]